MSNKNSKVHIKRGLESNLSPEMSQKTSTSLPQQRTLGQSWLAIPRKTRLVMSCILFGTAAAGLWMSDKLEESLPAQTQEKKP